MATIPPQSTPFPNALIDTIMPTLKDTELRLLFIVVRQTLGWQETAFASRKEHDWLTQRQLMQRTGRASAAVSQAIDALVKRNLIEVVSETGELLHTPQARQHYAGRLLFRLAPHLLTTDAPQERLSGDRAVSSSESKQGCLKSEVRKANTTKETEYKKKPNGVTPRIFSGNEKKKKASPAASDNDETLESSLRPDSDIRRFLLLYRDLFAHYSPRGEMPYIVWEKDGKLVQRLLKQYSYDRLAELLKAFFASQDAWVRKCGYALTCFPTLLPALLMAEDAEDKVKDRLPKINTPVVLYSPSGKHMHQAHEDSFSLPLSDRFPDLAKRLKNL